MLHAIYGHSKINDILTVRVATDKEVANRTNCMFDASGEVYIYNPDELLWREEDV